MASVILHHITLVRGKRVDIIFGTHIGVPSCLVRCVFGLASRLMDHALLLSCGGRAVLKWTEDKGTTWMEAPMTEPGEWRAQPTVTRLKNGHLFGFHRDREGMYLYSTTSTDDGKTWTKAKRSKLPNNNSGIQVTTLKSGAPRRAGTA